MWPVLSRTVPLASLLRLDTDVCIALEDGDPPRLRVTDFEMKTFDCSFEHYDREDD